MTDTMASGRVRTMTPSEALSRYLGEITRQGKSRSTLRRYDTYVGELAEMYPHVDIEDLPPAAWMKWLDRICTGRAGRHLDVDTVAQRTSIAKTFTGWLVDEEILPRDPLARVKAPRRKNPVENDNVVWVTPEETQRMIAVAQRDILIQTRPDDKYRKMLCIAVLAYTGARRGAAAQARFGDYDGMSDPPMLTFHEKGGKRITKPCAKRLSALIQEADLAGVWKDPNDYLIPPYGYRGLTGGGRDPSMVRRDGRAVYRLVKQIAAEAGVNAHVHAMRAAFACYFLEANPDQLTALKNLMGHAHVQTTETYLRRLNRQKGMEVVVDLDWGEELSQTVPLETHPSRPVYEEEPCAAHTIAVRGSGDTPSTPATAPAADRLLATVGSDTSSLQTTIGSVGTDGGSSSGSPNSFQPIAEAEKEGFEPSFRPVADSEREEQPR